MDEFDRTPGGAIVLDARRLADERIEALRLRLERAGLPTATLATVSAEGGHPPVGLQVLATRAAVGVRTVSAAPGQAAVEAVVAELAADRHVHGLLLQSPLPAGYHEESILRRLPVDKDVGGVTPASLGRLVRGAPGLVGPTALAVMRVLDRYRVVLAGRRAVVVGRSPHVGTATALLLGRRGTDSTVTQVHSATADAVSICRQADILVCASNRPGSIGVDHVAPGAVVIDVGFGAVVGGVSGDVDFDAVQAVAGAITPPGSIGPLTLACLVENTVAAARAQGALGD
jgi:methylenetetrahydrofolate dehydrogenase (NADP+) / methenyltetrahydrofolate cyclohydrolase